MNTTQSSATRYSMEIKMAERTMKDQKEQPAHTPENIAVEGVSEFTKKAAASWHMDGASFHVWFNIDTNEIGDTLYKNPLVSHNEPGYFDTRKLDLSGRINAAAVAYVFAEIERKGLISIALADSKEKERIRVEENERAIREERIKETGLELLEALEAIMVAEFGADMKLPAGVENTYWGKARDVIAKARGEQ